MEKSFCLITEPWIKAMDMNGSVRTFSLQDALTSAQDIQILSGEIANQDFAVLRFLLSIMQTVVYRYDENGNKSDITTASEALRRWDAIHKAGHFPGNAITDYLAEWNDYFWLIHPEHPFYQITKRLRTRDGKEKTGTSIDRGRLIGAISESDNKPRFHASYSTAGKASIDDGELTRWILYFQAYDHKATKTKNEKGISEEEKLHPRVCWCGNLGAVYAEGINLFETLMLNLVLLRTDTDEETCWGEPKPHWENLSRSIQEDHVLDYPDNQAQLLSMPGRYLYTEKTKRSFYMEAYVGESIPLENSFVEQMTLWRPVYTDKSKTEISAYYPANIDYGKAMWKRFGNVLTPRTDAPNPGVVKWLEILLDHGLIGKDYIPRLRTICTVLQATQQSCYFDVKSDSLNVHVNLLSRQGEHWRAMIEKELTLTSQMADIFGGFFLDMKKASGFNTSSNERAIRTEGTEVFYSAVDAPIRRWLSELNADSEITPENAAVTWESELFAVADEISKKEVLESGASAIIGHDVDGSRINASMAYFKFWNIIRKATEHESAKVHWNLRYRSDRTNAILDFVRWRTSQYGETLDSSETKRDLAIIRRAVGRPALESSDACRIIFEGFPVEYRGKYGRMSMTENAIFAAFVIYAVYQQGSEKNLFEKDISFGTAARLSARAEHHMETPEDFAFVRKYLDRILVAETTDVLMIHMIHFIRLIRKYEIPFDFGLLAYDLFLFQIDEYKLSAKLAWEMDFMSTGYKNVEKEENTETADKPKKRKSKRLAAPKKEEN